MWSCVKASEIVLLISFTQTEMWPCGKLEACTGSQGKITRYWTCMFLLWVLLKILIIEEDCTVTVLCIVLLPLGQSFWSVCDNFVTSFWQLSDGFRLNWLLGGGGGGGGGLQCQVPCWTKMTTVPLIVLVFWLARCKGSYQKVVKNWWKTVSTGSGMAHITVQCKCKVKRSLTKDWWTL